MVVRLTDRRAGALFVSRRDRRNSVVSIGLHSLLEGPHLLDPQNLTTPLLVDGLALLTFQSELLAQPFFLMLQLLDLGLKFLYLLACLLILFTLKSIDCFE